MRVITSTDPTTSPARVAPATRAAFRIGAVQAQWHPDPAEHQSALRAGVSVAAKAGAELVCLPELTLSPYFAQHEPTGDPGALAEDLGSGPTRSFAADLAAEFEVAVHSSLYERAESPTELGYNTAIVVAADGSLLSRTRKLHIPRTAGYYEHLYFQPGPVEADPFPVVAVGPARVGLPTCWDQWFPEVARAYALNGADLLIYPTAIGSEPDHPDFDTQPLWQKVIVANGIANGLFMVAVNRIGTEGGLTFYGSSFVSDPYGRVLAQAPRDEPAVLVVDLDLDQRGDWLALFPFLQTRRPDAYGLLSESTVSP